MPVRAEIHERRGDCVAVALPKGHAIATTIRARRLDEPSSDELRKLAAPQQVRLIRFLATRRDVPTRVEISCASRHQRDVAA